MRITADHEKISTGAQPLCLERPSVATHVSTQPRGGGQCATQRERATGRQTAPRSGAADWRKPNDSIGMVRALGNRTTRSRSVGRGGNGRIAEAPQGENGPEHKRRRRNMGVGVEGGAHRHDVIPFSVCALTPQFSCGRSAQYAHGRRQ